MAISDSVRETNRDFDEVVAVAESVRHTSGPSYDMDTLAIIRAATEAVRNTGVDTASAIGRIELGILLNGVANKIGNGHRSYEALRKASWTLNPPK